MDIIFHKHKCYLKTERGYKEILSSTDKSLELPEPSEGFIKVYIEAYNSNNPITEVDIEYEQVWEDSLEGNEFIPRPAGYRLKITPKDNTITIKKTKDNYNREEVEVLLHALYSDLTPKEKYNGTFFDNWIDKNL